MANVMKQHDTPHSQMRFQMGLMSELGINQIKKKTGGNWAKRTLLVDLDLSSQIWKAWGPFLSEIWNHDIIVPISKSFTL